MSIIKIEENMKKDQKIILGKCKGCKCVFFDRNSEGKFVCIHCKKEIK